MTTPGRVSTRFAEPDEPSSISQPPGISFLPPARPVCNAARARLCTTRARDRGGVALRDRRRRLLPSRRAPGDFEPVVGRAGTRAHRAAARVTRRLSHRGGGCHRAPATRERSPSTTSCSTHGYGWSPSRRRRGSRCTIARRPRSTRAWRSWPCGRSAAPPSASRSPRWRRRCSPSPCRTCCTPPVAGPPRGRQPHAVLVVLRRGTRSRIATPTLPRLRRVRARLVSARRRGADQKSVFGSRPSRRQWRYACAESSTISARL
jgi:hypothetical protein